MYTRMPFGIKNGTSIYSRAMDNIFGKLLLSSRSEPNEPIAINFVDDILVFGGETFEEHIDNVCKVLDRGGAAGMLFKPKKTEIGASEATFSGSRVTAEGVRPTFDKVSAVLNLVPDNLFRSPKEVKSVVGLAQYYSRHIEKFSQLAKPLRSSQRPPSPPA